MSKEQNDVRLGKFVGTERTHAYRVYLNDEFVGWIQRDTHYEPVFTFGDRPNFPLPWESGLQLAEDSVESIAMLHRIANDED